MTEPELSQDQHDLHNLLNAALDVATEHLTAHSEFAPFALAMQATDGEVFHLEPDAELDGAPGDEIVEALAFKLRNEAANGRWRAVGIAADVTLEDEDDEPITAAIHLTLEHLSGESVVCVVPYSIEGSEVALADLMTETADPIVFERQAIN